LKHRVAGFEKGRRGLKKNPSPFGERLGLLVEPIVREWSPQVGINGSLF